MIMITKVNTYGWETATRGMRNPMNSWNKSDSTFEKLYSFPEDHLVSVPVVELGENDLKLMKKLVAAGSDHSKFMRMINVTMDIEAPLYWWKEYDTYKVATVTNSCSTMHKIHTRELTRSDFSTDHLSATNLIVMDMVISALNNAILDFKNRNDKRDWWQIIQLLPSSYNQKRTVQLNYAVLRNIYHARKGHKLDEWYEFCRCVEALPYSELITE